MNKKINKSLIMNVIFLVFTLCIYAPLELYLSNYREFWFSLSLFVYIPLALGIIGVVIAIIIGYFLQGRLLILYEALLFGFGINVYIQGNFLNLKIGVMNGADIAWNQYHKNFVINAVIWGIIFLVILISAFKATTYFRKFSFYLSTLFTLTQLVSLMVLLYPYVSSDNLEQKKSYFISDEGLYELGEDENVVVFLCDMLDDSWFRKVMEYYPEIETELDGFTYFSNFSGSYSTTTYSLSHLSTGKYFYNEKPRYTWIEEVSDERIYFDELMDNGYNLGIYTNLYRNFPSRIIEEAENYEYASEKISNKLHFTYDIYQLVMCKYFPNVIKPYIWMTGSEFNYWKQYDSDHNAYNGDFENIFFKNGLDENGLSISGNAKQYKFIHLMGSHYPFDIDANAYPVDPDNNYVSGPECARGVLRIINSYLENMKQIGCYDNTSVIIMADHGYYEDGYITNPVLLVKPKASRGELIINTAPVCQGDFAATVLELADIDFTSSYGKSVFDFKTGENRERFFYQYYLSEKEQDGNYRLIEYLVDSKSNSPGDFEMTDVEYTTNGNKIIHSKYCQTCKNGIQPERSDSALIFVHEKAQNYPD